MCHKNCFIRKCGHTEWSPDDEIKIIVACNAAQKVSQKAGGFVPCAPQHQENIASDLNCQKCMYGTTRLSLEVAKKWMGEKQYEIASRPSIKRNCPLCGQAWKELPMLPVESDADSEPELEGEEGQATSSSLKKHKKKKGKKSKGKPSLQKAAEGAEEIVSMGDSFGG